MKPHKCFFCGSDLDPLQTASRLRLADAGVGEQSAASYGLSELSYVPPHDREWYWLLLRMKGYTLPMIAARWAVRDEKVRRAIVPLLRNNRHHAILTARRKFQQQRQGAKKRGILWHFTFEQWWGMWRASGVYGSRGTSAGKYVMARTDDVGPYAPWNVRICPQTENIREYHENRRVRLEIA